MRTHNDNGEQGMSNLPDFGFSQAAYEELRHRAKDMAARLDRFLNSTDSEVFELIDGTAKWCIEAMAGTDPEEAGLAARRALATAMDPDPGFWRGALGRLIAMNIGYGQPVVPRVHAAHILGITRQRVSQLEASGLLEGISSGILNESLLRRLHTQRAS